MATGQARVTGQQLVEWRLLLGIDLAGLKKVLENRT
jgi:hypothetical protein